MTQDLLRPHLTQPLDEGWNPFLENDAEIGIDFGVFRLSPGGSSRFASGSQEMALLVIEGKGTVSLGGTEVSFDRTSYFEQSPWAVHLPQGEEVAIQADTQTDLAVVRTLNPDKFSPHVYLPHEVEDEHRGQGLLDDTCHRIVRTIFDRRNAPPEARLVLGEVVNFPGKWSSYPPHHHTQPELYYYRFSPEWGYGHGELGESVFRLQQHDLLRITGERDHAQSSPPGIFMYYVWTIRHLPDNPYTGFEFTAPFDSLLR